MSVSVATDRTRWPVHDADFALDGGVAVVTGAASGLGLAIARACAARRMRLVLADRDSAGLEAAVAMCGRQSDCVGRVVDVRDRTAVDGLADTAFGAFGAVNVLFNNAGVVVTRPLLETTAADWRWMLDVNLWGVIHGIAAFAPRMLAQGREARIVNTASAAGFLSEPDLGAYAASKCAVVALSETLHAELHRQGADLGVTVLSPAFVPTAIVTSERARPSDLALAPGTLSEAARSAEARLQRAVQSGKVTAAEVAARVLDGIRRRRLHVFTHAKIRGAIEARMQAVYDGFAP
jgi:NAD(P)-dependent dehydrogenase (short-subunit alcohol dehydrogenase family)